jgi:hypothetical protein
LGFQKEVGMRRLAAGLLLLLSTTSLSGQQVPDSAFHFQNPYPAFDPGSGPRICIDGAHHNFHRIDGRYLAFATLLREDGYRVQEILTEFSPETLDECEVLVIANAAAAVNAEDRSYPHPSAFSKEEINAVLGWVRAGGGLFLVVDHAPWPGAAADLSVLLGFALFDGYVGAGVFGSLDDEAIEEAAEIFDLTPEELRNAFGGPGKLGQHPILSGSSPREAINSVYTGTGHAFFPSESVDPILTLGVAPGTVMIYLHLPEVSQEEWPGFSLSGWLQAGARDFGEGRVVVLGEASTCSAQLAGPQRTPMGMNSPLAKQNAQFCLNVVHWLSGLL